MLRTGLLDQHHAVGEEELVRRAIVFIGNFIMTILMVWVASLLAIVEAAR